MSAADPRSGASTISVDGVDIPFTPGWTVAAAISAHGDPWLRRSVRDEPRGALCGMGICHECRVLVDGIPHRRACRVPCRDGMVVHRVWPAGLGAEIPPPSERPVHARASVVVVGAGPAGLAAARSASREGAKVWLVDAEPEAGGQIWRRDPTRSPAPTVQDLTGDPAFARVTYLRQAEVIDGERLAGDDDGAGDRPRFRLVLRVEGRPSLLDTRTVILATGARERLLPFPGWTLPGVSGVGGLQALTKRGAPVVDARVVIAGTGPLSLAVADLLRTRGARVVTIAESASWSTLARFGVSVLRTPSKLIEALGYARRLRGVPRRVGWWVSEATGDDRLRRVVLTDGRRRRTVDADLLAASAGLVPSVELASRLGARLAYDHGDPRVDVDDDQATSVPGLYAAGEATGVGGVDKGLAEGRLAGITAARALAADDPGGSSAPGSIAAGASSSELDAVRRRVRRWRSFADALAVASSPRAELRSVPRNDTILCRCEDIPLGDVRVHPDWRTAKLQTRTGMGPCQGRVCGTAVRFLLGWEMPASRTPIIPTSLQSLVADGEAVAANETLAEGASVAASETMAEGASVAASETMADGASVAASEEPSP